jgi:hypothetical protein
MLNKVLNLLIPKEKKFFVLFKKASENLIVSSEILSKMMLEKEPYKRETYRDQLTEYEHVGDSITHEILKELSVSFITPFDREDIHSLAVVLDDVLDYIHGSASRMVIYKVDEITEEMVGLAKLIEEASREIHKAISHLHDMGHANIIHNAYLEVNRIENDADDIFDSAIGKLFEFEKDPIRLIKYKEIYMALETATDMAEDAVDLIKSIQVKNA